MHIAKNHLVAKQKLLNEAKELFQSTVKERMFTLIDKDFSSLMSSERIKVIKMCLDYRFQEINKRIL